MYIEIKSKIKIKFKLIQIHYIKYMRAIYYRNYSPYRGRIISHPNSHLILRQSSSISNKLLSKFFTPR